MDAPFQNTLTEIADSMGISLYQRFTPQEASLFLRSSVEEVNKLRKQGIIHYIDTGNNQVEFFGFQLLEYLLSCVSGNLPQTGFQNAPDRIIRTKEVQSLTGLSRTSIWRLERKGEFPARVPLGTGSVGWKYTEVQAWVHSR